MENQQLISVDVFCAHHQIGISFIKDLNASGLLELKIVEEKNFLPETELRKLEQLVRMHYELDINLEGLEVVSHLLGRLQSLQDEITFLKNKLHRFDVNEPDQSSRSRSFNW